MVRFYFSFYYYWCLSYLLWNQWKLLYGNYYFAVFFEWVNVWLYLFNKWVRESDNVLLTGKCYENVQLCKYIFTPIINCVEFCSESDSVLLLKIKHQSCMFNFKLWKMYLLENESPMFCTTEDIYKSFAAKRNTELHVQKTQNVQCTTVP